MTALPRLLSLDVETAPADHLPHTDDPKGYALEPCRLRSGQAQLLSIAVAYGTGRRDAKGFYKPSKEKVAAILQGAVDTNTVVVAWNSTFDVAWLIALGLKDLVYKVKWLDGMLLRRHLYNQMNMTGFKPQSLGLKACIAEKYTPAAADYGAALAPHIGDMRHAHPADVVHYNCEDARYTWDLTQTYWDRLSPRQQQLAALEGVSIPMFAECLVEGIDVDPEHAKAMHDSVDDDMKLALVSFSLAVNRPITSDVLKSPDQLAILLKEVGVPLERTTSTGKLSVDAATLAPLAKDFPIIEHALRWRGAHKLRSTYTGPVSEASAYNPDGRVRPQARMFGTYTGRLTFSSTNKVREPGVRAGSTRYATVQVGVPIHQWPHLPMVRDIMVTPPGMTLLEADFKGQEYRWMAEYSRDTQMIRCCEPDIDAHTVMAAAIQGVGYDALVRQLESEDRAARQAAEEVRKLGKVANLACQYRIGVPTLRDRAEADYGVVLTETEAAKLRESYKQMYRAVPRYWNRAIHALINDGYVTTFAGRRIHPPKDHLPVLANHNALRRGMGGGGNAERDLQRWQLEQTGINGPIQGSGADQKYLALAIARDYILGLGGRLWLDLHDGLYFLVPDAVAQQAATDIHAMLSNLPYEQVWGKKPVIDFPVEVKLGKKWGQLDKVHG
jgi:DNA polymerase I-like protein with 3'-5' exonuclease and polymerase domains